MLVPVNKRIVWIDALKGFAILWLIIYHFYVFKWLVSPVPIFFFVSGLFYSDSKGLLSFTKRKVKALLVPFLFFYLLGVGPSLIVHLIHGECYDFSKLANFFTLIPSTSSVQNPLGVGAIWFLVSLFEMYFIYYALRKVSVKRTWIWLFSVILLTLSAFISQYYAMGSVCYIIYTCGFFIYFSAGNLLKNYVLTNAQTHNKTKYNNTTIIVVLSIVALLMALVPIENYTISFLRDRIAGMGLIWILVLFFKTCCRLSNSFLSFEGRNSLTILGTHLTVMGGSKIVVSQFNLPHVAYYLLMFLLVVICCNLLIFIFNRYVPYLVNHK